MNENPNHSFNSLFQLIQKELSNSNVPLEQKEAFEAKLDLMLDDFITKCKEIKLAEPKEEPEIVSPLKITTQEKEEINKLIKSINPSIVEFIAKFKSEAKKHKDTGVTHANWLKFLFPKSDYNIRLFEVIPYWKELPVFYEIKKLAKISQTPIYEEFIELISENLQYDNLKFQWKIHYSFFNQISTRLFSLEDKKRATRMYIVHENLHFDYHGFSSDTVGGTGNDMGNYPNCVEEADYQADVFTILTELSYQRLNPDSFMEHLSMKERILHIIKVAIETTFSFIPGEIIPLKSTQIRRVNRTFIWSFIYELIYSVTEPDDDKFFNELISILVKKPIVELWGPNIYSKDYRTFFSFKDLKDTIWMGTFYENKINRFQMPVEATDKIIDGIRTADFDSIIKGMRAYLEFTKITKK